MIAEAGGEAPVQAKVEARHVAATLLEGTPQSNIQGAEIRDVMDFKRKNGGEEAFRRETNLSEADSSFVNYEDLQNIVFSEPPGPRRDMLQHRLDAYEKILENNTTSLSQEEVNEINRVIAEIPGFCEAMAVEISASGYGAAFTSADVKAFLIQDPNNNVMLTTQDATKIISGIDKFIKNPKFKKLLKSNLSKIVLPDNDAALEAEIEKLNSEIAKEAPQKARLLVLQTEILTYEGSHDENVRKALDGIKKSIDSKLNKVDISYRPFDLGSIDSSLVSLRARKGVLETQISGATGQQQGLQDKLFVVDDNIATLEAAKALYDPRSTELSEYEVYLRQKQETDTLKTEIDGIQIKKTELKTNENKRKKYLNKNKAELEGVLDHAVATHWNQNLLSNAEQTAFSEAKNKAETKGEKQEMAKFILEKYLRLHLLEYEANGHAKGWNKTKIKQYRDQLLSKSPADMMRVMVQNIYDDMGTMPATYQDELKAELKKIGIETSVQFTDYVTNLDTKFLYGIAPENVAVTLGYSLASGNWITREKFGKAEIEFLQINYGKDFWQKAFANQEQYQHVADAHGLGTLKLGDAFGRSFDGLLQKNPGEFFAKLLKILAILGLVGLIGGGIGLGATALAH